MDYHTLTLFLPAASRFFSREAAGSYSSPHPQTIEDQLTY